MTTQPSARTTTRATFAIERTYRAAPARVFAAWCDIEARRYWFAGGDAWTETLRVDDIRAGGQSQLTGVWRDGTITTFHAWYADIVPNERVIFTYEMHHGGPKISVSLATVEFSSNGDGTRLVFTEHLVCLDGYDDIDARDRESGTRPQYERLAAYLERERAT